MNQGRIWCVVHPTVGLPLFLGSVALTSLAVHASVMTHTTWMSSYWAGKSRTVTTSSFAPSSYASPATAPYSVTVTPVPATLAGAPASFTITVTPQNGAPVHTEVAAARPVTLHTASLK